MGMYTIESKPNTFNIEAYAALVDRTTDEVREIRGRQKRGAESELEKYTPLTFFGRWTINILTN